MQQMGFPRVSSIALSSLMLKSTRVFTSIFMGKNHNNTNSVFELRSRKEKSTTMALEKSFPK